MTPISPVLPNCRVPETVFARDQPEYILLPAIRSEDGMVTTRWRLTWRERVRVLLRGYVYLQVLTHNMPLQPMKPAVFEWDLDDPAGLD